MLLPVGSYHLMWSRQPRYSQLIWSQNADVFGPGALCSRAATARGRQAGAGTGEALRFEHDVFGHHLCESKHSFSGRLGAIARWSQEPDAISGIDPHARAEVTHV